MVLTLLVPFEFNFSSIVQSAVTSPILAASHMVETSADDGILTVFNDTEKTFGLKELS